VRIILFRLVTTQKIALRSPPPSSAKMFSKTFLERMRKLPYRISFRESYLKPQRLIQSKNNARYLLNFSKVTKTEHELLLSMSSTENMCHSFLGPKHGDHVDCFDFNQLKPVDRNFLTTINQCCGSVTFLYRSGSSDL
jgi:hypothetical protein